MSQQNGKNPSSNTPSSSYAPQRTYSKPENRYNPTQKQHDLNSADSTHGRVYVCQFPTHWKDADIRNLFKEFSSKIQSIRIPARPSSPYAPLPAQNRGMGFVHFSNPKDALEAIKKLNGTIPENGTQQIIVKLANPRNYNLRPQGLRQCMYFQQGSCRFQEKCNFLHGDQVPSQVANSFYAQSPAINYGAFNPPQIYPAQTMQNYPAQNVQSYSNLPSYPQNMTQQQPQQALDGYMSQQPVVNPSSVNYSYSAPPQTTQPSNYAYSTSQQPSQVTGQLTTGYPSNSIQQPSVQTQNLSVPSQTQLNLPQTTQKLSHQQNHVVSMPQTTTNLPVLGQQRAPGI